MPKQAECGRRQIATSDQRVMRKMDADKTPKPTRMREPSRMNLLATPLFVASISILAVNDFFLKATFHNWLTGKLSDVAGLIACTVFACAIWPSRRWVVALTISTAFLLWKSPYSQPIIDLINSVLPFSIGRTPDYSDLIALPGVWLACLFIFRLRPWPMRSWIVGAMAVLSLFLFTATSYIPMHRITRTALIPASGDQGTMLDVERQLQDFFDKSASLHELRCVVCDPLSSGRLYVRNKVNPLDFALVVNFDAFRGVIFFDARSVGPETNAREIDLLSTEIEHQLQMLYPNVKTEKGRAPEGTTISLGVSKRNSYTSYDPGTRAEYEEAVKVVEAVVSRLGLKLATTSRLETVFCMGRLFGPRPTDRELVVNVQIADSPLVRIAVTSYSPQYSELQRKIIDDLKQELQATFGKERAWVR